MSWLLATQESKILICKQVATFWARVIDTNMKNNITFFQQPPDSSIKPNNPRTALGALRDIANRTSASSSANNYPRSNDTTISDLQLPPSMVTP